MKRHSLALLVVVAALSLMSVFATSALAHPSSGICSGCHSLSSSVTVKATETANNGTTASYSVSVKGPGSASGWAVYSGSTRLTYASGATGSFNVAAGKTYTVFGGNVGNSKLYNTVSISPVASGSPNTTGTPAPDTTTPVATTTYRYHFNLHGHHYSGLKAVLKLKKNGRKFYAGVSRKGYATFTNIPVGNYRLSTTGNKHFKFGSRTVAVRLPNAEQDD